MPLSWIEDVVSEYYSKTNHLVFNNVTYFDTTPGKKQPAWQEFDILTIKDGKATIISCKRGLTPKDYDKQARMLLFHRKNLLEHQDLEKYRKLFSEPPELILFIEYPREEHVERIEKEGIRVKSLIDMLRDYMNLLKAELDKSNQNEGKENNYATRLLKGLLKHEIIEVKESKASEKI